MNIIIKNTAGKPIYEQIKEQIKEAILAGDLDEGEMLPSIRKLAHSLRISVITTSRAYTDLEEEGYVVNVQGKGCFVAPKNNDLFREQVLRSIEEHLAAAADTGKVAKLSRDDLLNMLALILDEHEYE